MRNKSKNNNIICNDKGSALIVCIIILLFVSILATVILYISGINYRMKKAEYNTKYSFYAAEEPLERIESNMIIPISESLNNAFVLTNSVYAADETFDEKRKEFYIQFAKSYKDIMLKNYAGSSIGSSGETLNGPTAVKNIIYNLSSCDNSWNEYNDENYVTNNASINSGLGDVSIDRIFVNGETIGGNTLGGPSYAKDPYGFVNWLCNNGYIDVDGSEELKLYIVISDYIPNGLNASDGYDRFIMLNVTDPVLDTHGNYDAPVYPIRALKPVDDPGRTDKPCLVMRNVAVVAVHNGYRSIVCTDISFQFPPFDWNGGSTTSGYNQWNTYQLIYYTNWQRY